MLHALNVIAGQAVVERLTLLINHVLTAEPIATQRLRAHTGRCLRLQFDAWPSLLPALPATAFRITPAGLLEWCGAEYDGPVDLRVAVDASNPALSMLQSLTGTRPKLDVAGDAALAADLNWLFDNVRWDVQDDLSRLVGAAPAREISRLGTAIAAGLRDAARGIGGLVQRSRGTRAEPSPE